MRTYSAALNRIYSGAKGAVQPMVTMHIQEGRIPVTGGKVWYRVVGAGRTVPLLTLHGGPGAGHDYLESLEALLDERAVILYDQLGCGLSDKPDDRSLWTIDRFVHEVDEVRDALGLERIHLFGQSWGGWLAIEYMLSKPHGVVSLTLASTSASTGQFVHEAQKLIDDLPPDMREALHHGNEAQTYDDPAYVRAAAEFYQRHVCRLDPWPEPLLRTGENLEGNQVYLTMNGPNEFTVVGNLKDWDRTDRLGEITVPTLITVGRYDEITPACAETLHRGIPNSELHLFEQSAHCAHLEEPAKFNALLRGFLHRVEEGQAPTTGS